MYITYFVRTGASYFVRALEECHLPSPKAYSKYKNKCIGTFIYVVARLLVALLLYYYLVCDIIARLTSRFVTFGETTYPEGTEGVVLPKRLRITNWDRNVRMTNEARIHGSGYRSINY